MYNNKQIGYSPKVRDVTDLQKKRSLTGSVTVPSPSETPSQRRSVATITALRNNLSWRC